MMLRIIQPAQPGPSRFTRRARAKEAQRPYQKVSRRVANR